MTVKSLCFSSFERPYNESGKESIDIHNIKRIEGLRLERKKLRMLKIIFSWLPVIVLLGVIFLFSSQDGEQSFALSETITQKITGIFDRNPSSSRTSQDFQTLMGGMVRKAAHFIEYFLLALLIYLAARHCKWNVRSSRRLAFILCFLFASMDELHQWFVPGRTSVYFDVIIDLTGAVSALGMVTVYNQKKKQT